MELPTLMWIIYFAVGWFSGFAVNYLVDFLLEARRVEGGQLSPWSHYLYPQREWRWRTWVVWLLFMGAGLWFGAYPPVDLGYLWGLALLIYFGVVTVIDLEHRLILHPVSLAGAGLALGLGSWLHGWRSTLLGGAAGFGGMLILFLFGELFARWITRRRGADFDEVALGFGDVNLAGVLGLLLGWPGIVGGLVLAILLGGVFSLLFMIGMLIFRRYRVFTAIPYGPFLVASGVLLLYFPQVVWSFLP